MLFLFGWVRFYLVAYDVLDGRGGGVCFYGVFIGMRERDSEVSVEEGRFGESRGVVKGRLDFEVGVDLCGCELCFLD